MILKVARKGRKTTTAWQMSKPPPSSMYILSTLITFSFYDNSTDFYIEGWGQSFHFCRYPRGREPKPQAMARHEHYMAHKLNLTARMTVLDAGCGIGGPAKEIATFADCKVVGLNLNAYQIEKGREIALKEGVGEDVLELVEGDFMVSKSLTAAILFTLRSQTN